MASSQTASRPSTYVTPMTIHDRVGYLSGQLPRADGSLVCVGTVGAEIDLESARAAARLCAEACLTVLDANRSQGRLLRVLKVTGFVPHPLTSRHKGRSSMPHADRRDPESNRSASRVNPIVPGRGQERTRFGSDCWFIPNTRPGGQRQSIATIRPVYHWPAGGRFDDQLVIRCHTFSHTTKDQRPAWA
jgi:enamine deaminase RidA (YjgF/YER057c/UK114 family)